MAEVPQQHHTWAPWLELNGVAIPWNSFIKEFQRGHFSYVVEALEHPFLLSKAALRHMRQPDLFMSLKKDLALVGSQSYPLV